MQKSNIMISKMLQEKRKELYFLKFEKSKTI